MTLRFLDRFHSRPATLPPMVSEGLAQVRAYWEGLRLGGALPARSMLDPRGLSGVLDRVLLAERIGPGLAQIRTAGFALADFAGTELRGLPLSCLFAAEARPLLAQSLERVFAEPVLAEFDLGLDRGPAGIAVARLLLLPLADKSGARMLLGALSFSDPVPRPGKLQVLSRREERVWLAGPAGTGPVVAPEATIVAGRQNRHLTLVHSVQ